MQEDRGGNGVYAVATEGETGWLVWLGFDAGDQGWQVSAGDQHVSHVEPPSSGLLPFNWENMESVLAVKILEHCHPGPPSTLAS